MNFKKALITSLAIGLTCFVIAGVFYLSGGHKLFKTQDNYSTVDKIIEKGEKLEGIKDIKVNSDIANVYFEYTDGDALKLELKNPIKESQEPIRIKRNKNTLQLDINKLNKGGNFHLGNSFRNMKESKLNILIPKYYKGNIDISSAMGDIKGQYSGGVLKLDTDMGNIDVELHEAKSGKITTDMGDVKVGIKEDSSLTLNLKTDLGEIKNNLKNTNNTVNAKDNDFKISQDQNIDINKGGNIIDVRTDIGNIELYNLR